jgi:hypothetical protein
MYRVCDLENGFDQRIIRRNVREDLAKQGNILALHDQQGNWLVKRTFGYSLFED